MQNKKIYIVLAIFLTSIILLSSSNIKIFKNIENFTNSYASIIIEPTYKSITSFINLPFKFIDTKKIQERNSQLLQNNTKITIENIRLKEKISLFESLYKIKDNNSNRDIISAEITLKDPLPNINIVKINKGIRDGIAINMPVLGETGTLVGMISSIYEKYSYVTLLNNKKTKIPIFLQNARKPGLLFSNGESLYIDFIERENKILIGDNVITSSLGLSIIANIPIGRIYDVDSKNDLFLSIEVEPFENYKNLNFVNILKDWTPNFDIFIYGN